MARTIVIVCIFAAIGCTATQVPPQTAGARPAADTDEAGIWQVMDREEERLKTSAMLERSPDVNRFARDLVCRLAGEYCPDIRVYVLSLPYFNAAMAPNGAMFIYTGLLLRAENEAQVAFVVAHELGHYIERHTIERWRTAKSASTAAMIFSLGTAVGGIPALGQIGDLVALSHFYGFSRDQEREADAFGFRQMAAAGYDPAECAAIWRYLVDEVAHSDFEEKRKRQARASIFNSHPLTTERIETLDALAGDAPPGEAGFERYRDTVSPRLGDWLRAELQLGDFGQTLFLIDRLIADDRDLGTLYFYKGEAYRLRHDDGDDGRSLDAYEKAIEHDGAPATVWRQLGYAYQRTGDERSAARAFATYLDAAPEAEDRMLIERYLSDLEDKGLS